MGAYNSENTTVIEKCEIDFRTYALLLRKYEDGSIEFVVADGFTECRYDGLMGYARYDYCWQSGSYFWDILRAAKCWNATKGGTR